MRKTLFFILLKLMVGSYSIEAQDKDDFILLKKEGPIAIYERWVNFPKTQPPVRAREVKGEFTVACTLYEALALIKNESKIKAWQSHVSEFKVYLQKDTTRWYEYSYHDIPWPVTDQDHFLVYHLTVLAPEKNYVVTFESKINSELAPVREDVDRMALSGSWHFEKIGKEKIKVTYKIISMPSHIPRFFTDPIIRRNMMNTIKSYIDILEKNQ